MLNLNLTSSEGCGMPKCLAVIKYSYRAFASLNQELLLKLGLSTNLPIFCLGYLEYYEIFSKY